MMWANFTGQKKISIKQLIETLNGFVEPISKSSIVRADYEQLRIANGLSEMEMTYLDYVKVRMIFESTRDGGFWNIKWDITDEEPSSKRIWQLLSQVKVGETNITAVAECDEISAFFAFLVYRMGVKNVGLFWPTYNHTVAVWSVGEKRIVVPNSQIFLTDEATLGTNEFDPWTQKKIYEYRKQDVPSNFKIPQHLGNFMIKRLLKDIDKPATTLQQLRNAHVDQYGGSQ